MNDILQEIEDVIKARKTADAADSYTASLFARGPEKCAEKFGEEAIEAVIAAVGQDRDALKYEAADVLFHLMVMLSARDVAFGDVVTELGRRQGVSGHDEKAARKKS